jgi:large repetitive protein
LMVFGENDIEVQAISGGEGVLGRLDIDYQTGGAGDADGDGYSSDIDCDDSNPWAWDSTAGESCDGYDNNCDGVVDEGLGSTYYLDADGDGYGDPDSTTQSCIYPDGYSDIPLDCDDANAWAWNTSTPESCDGYDNNCDGQADEGLFSSYYLDSDGDGYGDPLSEVESCELVEGHVLDFSDCDDGNAWAWDYDAAESCDGYDNNCDGQADEGITQAFYADQDGDGFGDLLNYVTDCEQPEGYIADNTDCDDFDAAAYPGSGIYEQMPELCRRDADGDGYGEESPSEASVMPGTDCDDSEASVFPSALEEWYDGVDQDCDGNDDDQDLDGFPSGADCDDLDESVYPGSPGLELDCSETPDDPDPEDEESPGDVYKEPALACSATGAPGFGGWGGLVLLGLAARRRRIR